MAGVGALPSLHSSNCQRNSLFGTPSSSTPWISFICLRVRRRTTNGVTTNHNSLFSKIQKGRPGFSLYATKKRRKGNNSPLGKQGFDEDDEEDDEDEEGMLLPFEGMKNWIQNKPAGFGEGKEYDTSIEDKLAEEIEQSRIAQLANINKLKNNPQMISSKKEQQMLKAPEVVPNGIRVRVGNLPKKKNVHRDLQVAFKGFPGIVSISPAVSGNKKTREPICKGFAFVYLKSEEAANRFIQMFSKQSIAFGKIQKAVTCEVTNPNESDSVSGLATKARSLSTPLPKLPSLGQNPQTVSNDSSESWDVMSVDEPTDPEIEEISADMEEIEEDIEHLNLMEPNDIDEKQELASVCNTGDSSSLNQSVIANQEKVEEDFEHSTFMEIEGDENQKPRSTTKTDSPSSKQQQPKSQKVKKKLVIKGKTEKVKKLKALGSAKRLKVKEKAVLAGALSRYGKAASLVSKKEN